MVGSLLDDPDLGQRAMLRWERRVFELWWIFPRQSRFVEELQATTVECNHFLIQIERKCASNQLGDKIDATHIVTRFFVITWFGRNRIVLFSAKIVVMPMTRMCFSRRMDAIEFAVSMDVMPATSDGAVDQHRQQCH